MVTPSPVSRTAEKGQFAITSTSIKPNVRKSLNAIAGFDTPGKLLQFMKLHRVCNRNLKQLQRESRKTLNLLALVTQFPISMEGRNELQFQCEREERARSDYQACQRELIALSQARLKERR